MGLAVASHEGRGGQQHDLIAVAAHKLQLFEPAGEERGVLIVQALSDRIPSSPCPALAGGSAASTCSRTTLPGCGSKAASRSAKSGPTAVQTSSARAAISPTLSRQAPTLPRTPGRMHTSTRAVPSRLSSRGARVEPDLLDEQALASAMASASTSSTNVARQIRRPALAAATPSAVTRWLLPTVSHFAPLVGV